MNDEMRIGELALETAKKLARGGGEGSALPEGFRARAYAVDSEGKALEEISWISTNYISQWCLNVMQMLFLAPEAVPEGDELKAILDEAYRLEL